MKDLIKRLFTRFPAAIATYVVLGLAVAIFILGLRTRV